MLVFYAVVSRHFGAGKLRQRIPGRSSFGPSCCMQALVSQLAGGERVHVVRCADLLGCVGVVARVDAQVAGRAGARYPTLFAFCLNWRRLSTTTMIVECS